MRFYHLDFVLFIFIKVIFICLSVFNPIWSFVITLSFPSCQGGLVETCALQPSVELVFFMETVRNCFSFPYHPEDLSYFQALFIFSNHPGNLSCCQAFSDQGTANSGCNGDATLKSVFNFWKNQVTRWSLSGDQVVMWPGDLFLLVFFFTNLLGFEQNGAGKRIGRAHVRNRPGCRRVGDNNLIPMQYQYWKKYMLF